MNFLSKKEPHAVQRDGKEGIILKFAYTLLLSFFFLLPFHALLVTWIRGMGFDSIWVTMWREVVLGILTVLAVVAVTLRHSKGEAESWHMHVKKIQLLDWLIVAYFLLGAVYFFYKRESVEQWMLGARYDFEFLYFYLLVRVFSFGEKEIRGFFKSALSAAVLVVIFGWVLNFLPQDFLTKFGYAPYADEWSRGTAVFACHYVEFDQSFCRMQSTFGGPGRYGLYLLFVIIASAVIAKSDVTLSLSKGDERRSNLIARAPCHPEPKAKDLTLQYKANTFHAEILRSSYGLFHQDNNNTVLGRYYHLYQFFWILFFLLSLGALYLTLSRSAWIGLFGALGISIVWIIKKLPAWKRVLWQSAIIVAFAILIFGALAPTSFKTIFIRADSSSAHLSALVKGVQAVMENPMGIGLGKAGPASMPFEKFLTENAYLQVAVEMGLIGGALFLAILVVILREVSLATASLLSFSIERSPQATASDRESIQASHHPLALISLLTLIALMISGLFVHSFEEMSLNLTLFGFIGILLDKKEK